MASSLDHHEDDPTSPLARDPHRALTAPATVRKPAGPRAQDAEDSERRATDRVRISMAVKQKVESRMFLCQASNLSHGGMFLARVFDRCYEQAPKCWLEFGLPGGQEDEHVAVPARIVRQIRRGRYHLMGISFSSLSLTHQRMLGQFLQTVRSPQELLAFETAAW